VRPNDGVDVPTLGTYDNCTAIIGHGGVLEKWNASANTWSNV